MFDEKLHCKDLQIKTLDILGKSQIFRYILYKVKIWTIQNNYSYNLLRSLTSNCGLSWCYQDKHNTMMSTASMAKYSKSQRAQSFQYIGPHNFNCFPSYLRDSIMEFFTNKELYDEFLSNSQYLHEPRNWAGWEIRVGSCKIPHHVETLLFFFLFVLLLV